jgi:hypothetical protein
MHLLADMLLVAARVVLVACDLLVLLVVVCVVLVVAHCAAPWVLWRLLPLL